MLTGSTSFVLGIRAALGREDPRWLPCTANVLASWAYVRGNFGAHGQVQSLLAEILFPALIQNHIFLLLMSDRVGKKGLVGQLKGSHQLFFKEGNLE